MKKYLVITGILVAGTYLQAAENLTFYTVLSKPVGSFWNLTTTMCPYPDISGQSNTSQSKQTVVNFGPTGQGGSISLQGGPMKVDTLLLEDYTTLEADTLLFAQPSGNPSDPNYDPGGKLSIFQGASLQTKSILVNNLIIPKDQNTVIAVSDTTEFEWDKLTVKNASLQTVGNFRFLDSSSSGSPSEGSSASFSTLFGADGSVSSHRYLVVN